MNAHCAADNKLVWEVISSHFTKEEAELREAKWFAYSHIAMWVAEPELNFGLPNPRCQADFPK